VHAQSEWAAAASQDADRVRQGCRDALTQLRSGLERLAALRGLEAWLSDGLPEARPMRVRGLLSAPSSARFAANAEPLPTDALLAFVSELVDPPEKPAPPEQRPLPGPPARAVAPVEAG
jgi:hypothetical protein